MPKDAILSDIDIAESSSIIASQMNIHIFKFNGL